MESAPSYEELNAMRLAHANQPEEVEETQQELIMRLLREQEQDAACAVAPAQLRYGRDRSHHQEDGVEYQRCGGGVRVIYKRIGSS